MVVWIALNIILLGILSFFIVTNLANLKKVPRLETFDSGTEKPRVSIIVPARNEENNIEDCLLSLLDQDYENLEVIVVNDNSTDATGLIVERIASNHPGLVHIEGLPLPKGWVGKNWACHQGCQAAGGDMILFTDADTRHDRQTVSRAVFAFHSTGADFMTALTGQETRSIGEKSVIPIVFWIAYSIFPFALMNAYRSLPLSFGNGQFMLMKREAYRAIGGYQAIRGNIFDDMTLAGRIRGHGMRAVVVDGSKLITCRMYEDMAATYKGLGKNIFMLFKYSLPRFLAAPMYFLGMILLGVTLTGPIVSIAACILFFFFGTVISAAIVVPSALGLLFSLCTFTIVYLKFRYPWYMILVYPLNVTVFLFIAFSSFVLTSLKKTEWKGRPLDCTS